MAHNTSRYPVPHSEPTVKRPFYPPPPTPPFPKPPLFPTRAVSESEKKTAIKKEDREVGSKVVVMTNNNSKGRRSMCNVVAELGEFLRSNSAKVYNADMAPFIQIHAVGFARKVKDSLDKFSSKSLALSLKKEFDGVYGPAWHVIVGSSFGSFVTHSVGGFLYFSLDQKLYVLLFKTTVQKAE